MYLTDCKKETKFKREIDFGKVNDVCVCVCLLYVFCVRFVCILCVFCVFCVFCVC